MLNDGVVKDRVVLFFFMCLANYGASEAVNLCSRYVEKSTKYSEQNAIVIFENKISCSLTLQVLSDLYRVTLFSEGVYCEEKNT